MCRRFDLWGSEHDMTTALRTSKNLFPFYCIIRPKNIGWLCLTSAHAAHTVPKPVKPCAPFFLHKSYVFSSSLPSCICSNVCYDQCCEITLVKLWLACASICPWLISLKMTFRDSDGAFKDTGVQMACRCLHCTIGIFANHCLCSCIMLSLKDVITGMEMKGDLKECTAVES